MPKPPKPPPRIIVRIELTQGAKYNIEDSSTRSGMTQVAMLSRLVEWFSAQDQLTQAGILGHYPVKDPRDLTRMIVERMVKER